MKERVDGVYVVCPLCLRAFVLSKENPTPVSDVHACPHGRTCMLGRGPVPRGRVRAECSACDDWHRHGREPATPLPPERITRRNVVEWLCVNGIDTAVLVEAEDALMTMGTLVLDFTGPERAMADGSVRFMPDRTRLIERQGKAVGAPPARPAERPRWGGPKSSPQKAKPNAAAPIEAGELHEDEGERRARREAAAVGAASVLAALGGKRR